MILTFLIRIGLILLALSACLALLNYTLRSSSKKKVGADGEGPSSSSPSLDIQENDATVAKVEPEVPEVPEVDEEEVVVAAAEEKKTEEVVEEEEDEEEEKKDK